jgi:endoribonuclease LACTB2
LAAAKPSLWLWSADLLLRPVAVQTRTAGAVSAFAARTPTLPPATHTNSYALGTREVLLVEPATPYVEEQREWLDWARSFTTAGRKLVGLFATHHHPDHIGGLADIARELNVPIYMHSATADLCGQNEYRALADGDVLVLDAPSPIRITFLHTPGHAPGHLCAYLPEEEVLLCGDMMAEVGSILIAPGDGNMAEYLVQLERLGALLAHTALPAHGAPIPAANARYLALKAHRLRREDKVLQRLCDITRHATAANGCTLHALLHAAYDDVQPALLPFAELSLRAHLEKLECEARIVVRDNHYAPHAARSLA